MQLSELSDNKKSKLLFAIVSVLFVVSQGFFFQGFNGTDDLHYAFLAHRMLQGRFSPFVLNDLFGGRTLLVAIQAAVYFVGGVSTFTTQAASYLAVVVACYLTVFKLLQTSKLRLSFIATSLFYFNPVIAGIMLGPAPDVFILLATVLLLLLLRKPDAGAMKNFTGFGVVLGLFIFATLFIKESGLVFLPFAAITGLFFPKAVRIKFIIGLFVSFLMAVAVCGCIYYFNTGDFLFRIKQLQAATYPNPCNYYSFFQKEMYIRLTYGVWRVFISQNFLPVIIAVVAIIQEWFSKKDSTSAIADKRNFLILLLIGLYFPFSVSNYQPLCAKSRHFLFLLPLAVVISSQWLEKGYTRPKTDWYRNAIAVILIGCSIKMENNGWNWDFYRCLLLFLLLLPFHSNRRLVVATPVLLAAILWLSLPYGFIYHRTSWFKDLQTLSNKLGGNYFYFADHDNLMHWKLFQQFNTRVHYYNLDPHPFFISNPYYEQLQFHCGWFIINRQYTTRTPYFDNRIDSLMSVSFFEKKETVGEVSAFYFSNQKQYDYLNEVMKEEKQRICNCDERQP